jgi:hypothetical protein
MAHECGTLWFWQVADGKRPKPAALFAALEVGESPAELADLDRRKIVAALKRLGEVEREGGALVLDFPDEEAAVEVRVGPRSLRADFFGDGFALMDRVAAAMAGLGLWCYVVDDKEAHPPERPRRFASDPADVTPLDDILARGMRSVDASGSADPRERLKLMVEFLKREAGGGATDTNDSARRANPGLRPVAAASLLRLEGEE